LFETMGEGNMTTMRLRCPYCMKFHDVVDATGPDDAWHEECWEKAQKEARTTTMPKKIKDSRLKCSICGYPIPDVLGWKYGHNAQPVNNGRCCRECNDTVVIPARLRLFYDKHGEVPS
jgi:hypothetical protein